MEKRKKIHLNNVKQRLYLACKLMLQYKLPGYQRGYYRTKSQSWLFWGGGVNAPHIHKLVILEQVVKRFSNSRAGKRNLEITGCSGLFSVFKPNSYPSPPVLKSWI